VNAHLKTLDSSVARFRPWRGQSYALDFFGTGPWGLRAPCAGTVVAAEGNMPDFEVPEQDPVNRLGNHVILRCGEIEIVFAHMRHGGLSVASGDIVVEGDRLGEVGNSGASTEPHLHIHAQHPAVEGAPPISGEPLALQIEGRFLVRGDRLGGR
jgi:murein DD-endopeptidase MepM/ murein hydrolase activator NlpD